MRQVALFLLVLLLVVPAVLAGENCDIDVSLLNQDPIPAVPGERLEVVYTISNIDSTDCGTITFEVLDEFPFKLEEGSQRVYTIESGTFTRDYNTQKTIPVDYFVNTNAIDGDNPIEVRYKYDGSENYVSKTYDVEVEDVRADFEIFVSDYNYVTKEITFEVLNIGKSDIEAVTVEVLGQEGITVYGTNKENIGDLSSNEDTSSDFVMDVSTSRIILQLSYSDSVQVRRTIEKGVTFNAQLFENTKDTGGQSYTSWIIIGLVVIVGFYFFFRRSKKKK